MLFRYMAKCANIAEEDLFATFNMGIGMMMVVSGNSAEQVMEIMREAGEQPSLIGKIVEGSGVSLC